MLDFLKGKKTYIVAAVVFILGGLTALGVIDKDLAEKLAIILTGTGLATLRASIK